MSAIPPHLQAQYRTTTPPSVPHTPPYGTYPPTNGGGTLHPYTSTPPNVNNNHGYTGQQQQQQQHSSQYQQPSTYPGYPPTTYAPASQAMASQQQQPTAPMPAAPSNNLTDALASIPDEQKVRKFVSRIFY